MSDADPRDYRSLGDLLRDAREEKQISLEQLNESTRISVRVLQALEQDDLEAASGLVYVRGFVRTLATFYDLDSEWLGAKLDALAGETSRPVLPVDDDDGVIAGPMADPLPEEPPEDTGPKWEVDSTRIRHVGAGSAPRVSRNLIYGLVAVLVLAIALVWSITGGRGGDNVSTARTELASLEEEPGPDAAENGSRLPPGENRVDPDPDPVPVATGTPEASASGTAAGQVRDDQPATLPAQSTGTVDQDSPADSPSADPAPRRMIVVEDSVSSSQTGLSSVRRYVEGEASSPMEFRIFADGPVEVTLSSDGVGQETRRLDQGEEWRLLGSDHFSLVVSDPAIVRVEIDGRARRLPLNWNGEEWILWRPRTGGGER